MRRQRHLAGSLTRPFLLGALVVALAAAGCAAGAGTGSPEQKELAAQLDDRLATDFNGSVLVAREGQILYSKGFGMADAANGIPNTPETRFRLGSITKQFTAMSILILESRGQLSSTDLVCDFVESCPAGWEEITIEHLLAHTSGIFGFTELPDFDDTVAATPQETVAEVADIPLPWKPGQNFSYSNTGYVLLGMVIEKVSGVTYEQFLEENIFGPLGMDASGYDHGDAGLAVGYRTGFDPAPALDMSVPYAAGGLYSTVLDMARWDAALYTEQLVPAEYQEKMFTPLVSITDLAGFGYAYGLSVGESRGRTEVFHDGGINGFFTFYGRFPDEQVGVVVLTNRENSPDLQSLARFAASLAAEVEPSG